MRRVAQVAAIMVAGSVLAGAAFQARPDFSGQWTVEPGPQAGPPAGRGGGSGSGQGRGGAQGRGDMGSGWGPTLTITQDGSQVIVEHALFSRYDLQPPIRLTYALDGSESKNAVMMGHATQVRSSRATWEGQVLRITTSYPGIDPASGKPFTTEVTHRLSLESPTSLVIEVIRGAALTGGATKTRTVYRRS